MNKNEIETEFKNIQPKYERLAVNVKNALIQFLNDSSIDYVDVETRVKNFDSFFSKIERKGYKNPLAETTDICGLRIINYYLSDLKQIESIIYKEFDVIEASNKEEEMDDDRFGYRSVHFIATLKKDWLTAPNYRGLADLKFEIQTRTILMHGWAAINHKLSYKHERDVPKKFKRDLFRLSALIEMADEQFERLRAERKNYSESFIVPVKGEDTFIPLDKLNTDSLQALLNYYFPNRESSNDTSHLVGEIYSIGMDLVNFNSAVISVIEFLEEIEKEESAIYGSEVCWTQQGAARAVLELTSNEYFQSRQGIMYDNGLLSTYEKWRNKVIK